MQNYIAQFSYKPLIGKLPKGDPRLAELAGNWTRCPNNPTVEMLLSLLKTGYVVAPGVYTNNYKNKANFERGQLVLMDFDDGVITWEQAKTYPFFTEHCVAAHTSCSHGIDGAEKFHVIALLPSPVTDAGCYDEAVKALRQHIPGQDSAMTANQCCFGNPNAEWVYWNNNNRLPELKLEEPKRDAFAEMVRLSNDEEPYESKVRKMKLCLAFIPERIDGEGTYNEAFDAACVLFNEFGVEKGYEIANECNWLGTWDLYRKLESIENDQKQRPKRLGSLIELVRDLYSPGGRYSDRERSEEFEIRLNQINGAKQSLATTDEVQLEAEANAKKVEDMIKRIVELEIDIDTESFALRETLIHQAGKLCGGGAKVRRRAFEHICAHFGVDIGNTKGNTIRNKGIDRLRKLAFRNKEQWLVPGFLHYNRDAIIYGDAGSGKTSIALDMARSMIQGRTFADGSEPCSTTGKILFIASDNGPSAEINMVDYLSKMNVLYDERVQERFVYWSANLESSEPSWNLNLANLILLQNEVKTGDYDLVIIDSLKATCAQTDYSIDDRSIGDVMRLVQGIVTPHAALCWIHHTNKSGKSSSHSAGGVTDIIEIPSAAFQVQRDWDDEAKTAQTNTLKVHKLRGEDSRQFTYDFDFLTGVIPHSDFDSGAREIELRKSLYPSAILVAMRDAPKATRFSRQKLADLMQVSPNTLDQHIKELKDKKLIVSHGTGYKLTKDGQVVARDLNRKKLEEAINFGSGRDF